MKVHCVKSWGLVALSLFAFTFAVAAQSAAADNPTFASVLDRQLSGIEHELIPAAEAMPADKFEFAPTQGEFNGVRTFAAQVKHIAAVNYIVGAAILGTKPPAEAGEGEDGPANVKSKSEIVEYLKDSFAYLHKAYNTITAANVLEPIPPPWGKDKTTRLALAVIGVSHPFDHYGQIVEYLRMNGIIPPASRS